MLNVNAVKRMVSGLFKREKTDDIVKFPPLNVSLHSSVSFAPFVTTIMRKLKFNSVPEQTVGISAISQVEFHQANGAGLFVYLSDYEDHQWVLFTICDTDRNGNITVNEMYIFQQVDEQFPQTDDQWKEVINVFSQDQLIYDDDIYDNVWGTDPIEFVETIHTTDNEQQYTGVNEYWLFQRETEVFGDPTEELLLVGIEDETSAVKMIGLKIHQSEVTVL